MVLKEISYTIEGKKKKIKALVCDTISKKARGLMFKKNSPPLFFIFKREKILTIHSFFCKPFRAIWLDEKMRSTKVIDVKEWKFSISGRGKFLLEIPATTKK